MKTTFVTLSAVILGASMALGAANPAPTAHHVKRQQFPDGIDLSAMLADPSSYLSGVSSALANNQNAKQYAALWASVTNDAGFQQSISSALVDQFGTKTAKIALAQYTGAVSGGSSGSGASSGSSASSASSGSSNNNNADADSSSNAQSQQVSNAVVTSGASGLAVPAGLTAFVLAAMPAVLLAAL